MRNILLKPVTHLTYWFFYVYYFLVLHSLSPDSVITNLHVVLFFSHSFLLVACWWMSYSHRHFPPWSESQNVRTCYQKCHFLRLGKPRDIGWPEPNFAGHIKPGKMYKRDSYLCSIYIQLLIPFRSVDLEHIQLEDRIKTSKGSLHDFRTVMTVECVPLLSYAVTKTLTTSSR